jgi:hypothetical protein
MTPSVAKAMYARQLTDRASITGIRNGVTYIASNVRSFAIGYQPKEIAGTIVQGDQKILLLKADCDLASFPTPLKGDKIVMAGRTLTVEAVDLNTRKVDQTVIAYEIQARG